MSTTRHTIIFSVLLATALALAGCASAPVATHATAPVTGDLQLQRVVMLMRHGVRPPTKATVTPPGYASEPWPAWQVPPGHLTTHGYKGAVLLGGFDRQMLVERGLLAAAACPARGEVVIWADTDQRTRETGRGIAQGLLPGCAIEVGHSNGDRDDPLFAAVELGAVPYDPALAKAAVMARAGTNLDSALLPLKKAFTRLDAILDCCAPPLCAASGLPSGCALGDIPSAWEPLRPASRVKFVGPLTIGGTAGQTLLLEYVDGTPMPDVGWGRASAADIALMSAIHAAEFDLLARPPYIADRAATPIMQRVLDNFAATDAPRLTVLVGHDTNVANVGGMLDLHWHAPGYAADDPAVNGALGWELLGNAAGEKFVRVFYQAQSTQQLRDLQPLDLDHPPYFNYLPQPLCGLPQDTTLCTVADFERTVRQHLVK